ncbi:MAG: WecB/TagA/CpsF family glycosyltransferase [Ilumatobacter sp.]
MTTSIAPPSQQHASPTHQHPNRSVAVVVAAFERPLELQRLVDGLAAQSTPPNEVIIVDDGSATPLAPLFPTSPSSIGWRLERQPNGGAGAARHRGIDAATSDVIIIVDDDMIVPNSLVADHLAAHAGGAEVVQGRFVNHDSSERPLFDDIIDDQQQRYFDRCGESDVEVEPARLATGNISVRRNLYGAVGGFDSSLARREDSELGLRLAASGARFGFAAGAPCRHDEQPESRDHWLTVAYQYGEAEVDIHHRHPEHSPWDLLAEMPAAVRMLVAVFAKRPATLRTIGRTAGGAAHAIERLGVGGIARRGYGIAYALHWFAGVFARFGPDAAAASQRAHLVASVSALSFGSLDVDCIDLDEAVDSIITMTESSKVEVVVTPNVDHVMRCQTDHAFAHAIRNASLRLADGQPLVLISRLLGLPLRSKLSGSDLLVPVLTAAAARQVPVFLFGSTPDNAGVAETKLLEQIPSLDIAGHASPFYDADDPDTPEFLTALEQLHSSGARLVVMAFGSPKQEVMVEQLRDRLPAGCYCCFGAAIDFSAGAVRRAPGWMSKFGIEWVWRLGLEPKRLWRRYLVDDIGIVRVFARMTARRLRRQSMLVEPSSAAVDARTRRVGTGP